MEEKKLKIATEDLKELVPGMMGCIASDMIMVDGEKVGVMYREETDHDFDSGWRFFTGKESKEYVDNPGFFAFYKLNTIANYDPAIMAYLDEVVGAFLQRVDGTDEFKPIEG